MTGSGGMSGVKLPRLLSWLPSAPVFVLFCCVFAATLNAAEPAGFQQQAQPDSEVQANVERLFAALVRNPRFGTSFERVVRWQDRKSTRLNSSHT